MKILREGNGLKFPYDSHLRCGYCHCEFQLEPGDYWQCIGPTRIEQKKVRVACPSCGKPVIEAGPLDFNAWADIPSPATGDPRHVQPPHGRHTKGL